MAKNPSKPRDANRDPITKAPGSHPVGTGVGAAVGGVAGTVAGSAVAGAVAGSAAGPIGTAAGLVAGAVIGAAAGHKIGEKIDPTVEDAYWREYYTSEPYYEAGMTYDDYAPAYRTGYEGYGRYQGRSFEEAETDLRNDYDAAKGRSKLSWERAKDATRAGWHRVERAVGVEPDRTSDMDRH